MSPDRPWSRPLAPLVLALMAGIAAPLPGLALPSVWLAAAAAVLFCLMLFLFRRGQPLAWAGCLLCFCRVRACFKTLLTRLCRLIMFASAPRQPHKYRGSRPKPTAPRKWRRPAFQLAAPGLSEAVTGNLPVACPGRRSAGVKKTATW